MGRCIPLAVMTSVYGVTAEKQLAGTSSLLSLSAFPDIKVQLDLRVTIIWRTSVSGCLGCTGTCVFSSIQPYINLLDICHLQLYVECIPMAICG